MQSVDLTNDLLNKKPYIFPKTPNKKNVFTIGEMYCGPGGLGLAAKKIKVNFKNKIYSFKHVWAIDNHKDTCLTYQKNISDNKKDNFKVICDEIQKVDLKKLPYVDGFLYGFPCNDFSLVGETKGLDGKYGPLYSYGVKYINYHKPKFFLAENVSGISSSNSGKAFTKILKELKNAGKHGYNITTHLYKFEDYGVPQSRHRFVVIGIRNDLNLKFEIPKPKFEKNKVSCKEAITKPPISKNSFNNEFTSQSKIVTERLKHTKAGENAWTANLPKNLQLNVKGAKLSMIYKRLDPKKPAYTVTGSGGGGTHIYHWSEPRALTNRERARLQTFPDNFKFFGSKESVRRQIGMAVPVKGAKIILESVINTLIGKKYTSIKDEEDRQLKLF